MKRLIAEFRRRKVGRVVLAYAAAAFIVLQVAELTLEPLGAPPWVMGVLIVLAALGFVVAAALAWAFDMTPDGIEATSPSGSAPVRMPAVRSTVVLGGAALLLVAFAGAWLVTRGGDVPLDADLVAVMPFRVTGDPSAEYLREGMIDLLATTLNGDVGPRAADPRTVLAAWRRIADDETAELSGESSAAVARAAGAGRMLLGTVIAASPSQLRISASLRSVDGNEAPIEAVVAGAPDELHRLIDDLTVQLLSLDAGMAQNRLASLTSTSLPALRAYLLGQKHYRASRFDDALAAFDDAIDADSTFALAALGFRQSYGWSGATARNAPRSTRLLSQGLDKLTGSDAVIARAFVGSYPEPRSVRAELNDWEQAIAAAPDRPETWFMFADAMLHRGLLINRHDHLQVSKQGFERSLALDSTFTPATTHLLDAAIVAHDTAAFHRYSALVENANTREVASYQYLIRTLFGRSEARAQLRASLDTLASEDLQSLAFFFMEIDIVNPEDALAAVASIRARAVTDREKTDALIISHDLMINLGRPAEAATVAAEMLGTASDDVTALGRIVGAGLLGGGDTVPAVRAAGHLDRLASRSDLSAAQRVAAACSAGQWRAWRGAGHETALAILTDASGEKTSTGITAAVCASLIRGLNALRTGENIPAALAELESLCRDGPNIDRVTLKIANRVSALLHEASGDKAGAYAAIRRDVIMPGSEVLLSSRRREIGRLAEATGDRDGAIEAYSQYLRVRSLAEPAVAAADADIRAALNRLVSDNARRP